MKIFHKGEKKIYKDNWFWICPSCHSVGYHETEDGYTEASTDGWSAFKCPICSKQIRDNNYFNRLIAWILYKFYYKFKQK